MYRFKNKRSVFKINKNLQSTFFGGFLVLIKRLADSSKKVICEWLLVGIKN